MMSFSSFSNPTRWIVLLTVFLICGCSTLQPGQFVNDTNSFGVLAFLPWDDDWNQHMYPKEKALEAMDLIKEAGIGWVRMDFSRTKIQPVSITSFQFEQFDWLVKELNSREISILGILGYSPSWAGKEVGKWNSPPKDMEKFAQYVYETVKRYRGKVQYWEIWNEPNLETYWTPQDNLETYSKLLAISYLAAKSANPDCRILNGGLAIHSAMDLEKLYEWGTRKYFDVANVHMFVGASGVPDIDQALAQSVDQLRQIMSSHHDQEKPLWITEIGFHGIPQTALADNPNLRFKPNEHVQEQMLIKTFTAAMQTQQVDKIFWAFFQDTQDHFPDGADFLGLIRRDFSRKPSFHSYQHLISSLSAVQ